MFLKIPLKIKKTEKNIKIKEKPREEIYELKRDMRRKILSSLSCSFKCNLSQPALLDIAKGTGVENVRWN
jgi:hypothetical protein